MRESIVRVHRFGEGDPFNRDPAECLPLLDQSGFDLTGLATELQVACWERFTLQVYIIHQQYTVYMLVSKFISI